MMTSTVVEICTKKRLRTALLTISYLLRLKLLVRQPRSVLVRYVQAQPYLSVHHQLYICTILYLGYAMTCIMNGIYLFYIRMHTYILSNVHMD